MRELARELIQTGALNVDGSDDSSQLYLGDEEDDDEEGEEDGADDEQEDPRGESGDPATGMHALKEEEPTDLETAEADRQAQQSALGTAVLVGSLLSLRASKNVLIKLRSLPPLAVLTLEHDILNSCTTSLFSIIIVYKWD